MRVWVVSNIFYRYQNLCHAVVITKGEHFGKTVSTLFDEKTGKVEIRNISNQYIQRGIAFEESVLQFFSTHRNVRVKNSGCYQNKILPLLRCSLDGECIINGENFDLEVKCLSEKVFNELQQHGINSDTYRKYWIQPKLALFSTSTGTNNSDGIGLCTFNLEMQ